MLEVKELESRFKTNGCDDFRWIDPKTIVVSQWVRMKCMFGCLMYGRNAACPPNVPSVEDCRAFFREYTEVVIFHFSTRVANPEDRHEWTRKINSRLLGLEREVFLAGYEKAFLIFLDSCNLCGNCAERREACQKPMESRPTPEALGVDVYTTVRSVGYPVEVLADYSQVMNRYAFLLID